MQRASSSNPSRSSKPKVSFSETTQTIPEAKKHVDPFHDARVRDDGKKRTAGSPERGGSAGKKSHTSTSGSSGSSGSNGTRKVLPAKGTKR
ncbi:9a733d77-cac3-4f30-93d2-3aba5eb14b9c-CDS [Sclerotinia trifoliorum]|uniref:9a733d77-cac3-4f30-93d2-3aba5eb14b9c-CDS n=1 Tax=Sclerotinia trifoliorum TaxID=28548 RepID=A0A8H2W3J1_9HELO|nr:9a733d77-cac3-4f30-93d2-3aba5eb14b9c-CDS [Sclerotinia trifoliorum]